MSVQGFRVALTTEAFENVVAFYRDGLGLDPGDLWTEEGGGRDSFCLPGQGRWRCLIPNMPRMRISWRLAGG